ncbi:hypothetical protein [Hydrogenophaga sp. ANAO-22]|uniref:hypothetical protein n=1 Tax=Hydrogenophaga sp. ANAO-22 TaxID=3166645 RepID=UPI0036D40DD9
MVRLARPHRRAGAALGVSSETRLLRADALRQTGQPGPSAALYDKLLDTPERAAAYRGLGLLAGAGDDYARAAEMFERARQVLPADGLLLSDLGYALLRAQRFDAARLPVQQAAQLLPTHPGCAATSRCTCSPRARPSRPAR